MEKSLEKKESEGNRYKSKEWVRCCTQVIGRYEIGREVIGHKRWVGRS